MTFLFAIKAMQNNVFISKLQIFSYSLTQKRIKHVFLFVPNYILLLQRRIIIFN